MTEVRSASLIVARQAAMSRRTGERHSFSLASLAFATAMFTDFLLELRGSDEIATLGSYHLHGADIAVAIGLLALVSARPRLGRLDPMKLLVLAIGSLVAFSLVRGAIEAPFEAAFAFRARAVTLIFLFYAVFSGRRLVPVAQLVPWIFIFLSLYIGLFILRSFLGPTLFLLQDSTTYLHIESLELRSVNSETILVLDLVLLMFLDVARRMSQGSSRSLYIVVAALVFFVIVLSRQRSANIAGFVGLATLLLTDPKFLSRYLFAIVLAGMLAVFILVIVALGAGSDLIQVLPESFQTSFLKTQTFSGRAEIWEIALDLRFANWDVVRQLFGPPAGEPLNLPTSQGLWQYSLHSQYVATIMNYGLIGALVWSCIVVFALVRAFRELRHRTSNAVALPPSVILAWLSTLLVYGIAYEWRDGAGFFLAMVLVAWPTRSAIKIGAFLSNRRLGRKGSIVRNPIEGMQ